MAPNIVYHINILPKKNTSGQNSTLLCNEKNPYSFNRHYYLTYRIILDHAQTAQTSTKAFLTSTESDPGFKSGFTTIRIRIQMSAGLLPKCCAFITLLASVISPSSWKSTGDCIRNANKSPKIPLFRNGDKTGKVIWNPYPEPRHHQQLSTFSDW